ncbi:Alpha/Beta hydrolase protein [Melampsora americana]|nr:Alpha/Beta hydrolase protein [Melampsora americana]
MFITPVFIAVCQLLLYLSTAQAALPDSKAKIGPASASGPTRVVLDYGDFTGKDQGGVHSWTSVPFAEPPLGPRRFASPVAPIKKYPNYDATKPSIGCPTTDPLAGSDASTVVRILRSLPIGVVPAQRTSAGQEDCLTLDIIKPSGSPSDAKLPVIFWIPEESSNTNSPTGLMNRAKSTQKPFIWVSVNWRKYAFGFLGGKEIAAADAANLGLKDQRLAMEWVQKYIANFGGDPKRVTLYGSNLGSMAVSHHLVAFNGRHNNLFHAAILGGAVAVPSPPVLDGQKTYDKFTQAAGCPIGPGSLACLRQAPFQKLIAAGNTFPGLFAVDRYPLPFHTVVDGKFLTASIETLAKAGKVAKVPVIIGAVEDSGTVDTLVEAAHIFDEAGVTDWLKRVLPGSQPEQLSHLLTLYPPNPSAGSPFDTGFFNVLSPVSKQMAAMFGDLAFQGIRRYFTQAIQASTTVYGFIDHGFKGTPYLGKSIVSKSEMHMDRERSFFGANTVSALSTRSSPRSEDIQDRYLSFVYTQDPNHKGSTVQWPKYGPRSELLQFTDDGADRVVPDNFRQAQISYYITNLMGDSTKGH